MENKVPVEVTRAVIETHLQAWRKELESFRVTIQVAEAIGDPEERKDKIRLEAERCVKAIEKLNSMLAELPKEGEAQ